jgi:hypothetical protein
VSFASPPKSPSRALAWAFLPFFALGLFFTVIMVREAIDAAASYTWQAVPCRIVVSEVLETNERAPWFAYLRYTSSAGESVRSSRTFGTYRDAVLFTRRWPAGSGATCYLDAGDPSGALLERKGARLLFLLFLPIPLLFVFIGAAGFCIVVFRVKLKPRVRRPANPVAGRRFAAGLLMGVGLVLLVVFLAGPVRQAIAARRWRTQECRILRSKVRRYSNGSGGDRYSPEILYSFTVNGDEHRCDTHSLFEYSGSGWAEAQRIANGYRAGSTVACYVNPADPDDATLDRDPSFGWLVGLVPLGMLLWGVRVWRR